ncbi:hypothetical protein BK139_08290 [Paenibacillus sp. FSL R5-0490]|uniref:DUF5392 family protein n=1 Tax=Paenibacillus sp. FSL R5-0490 TaxID=1920424 RepID=UPI00096D78BC|nr:DUF5392 family protein [Paenibacillus sp. FSL R5-0490]OMF60861.1 hypothetical protein BK139_08290 [Paenibacillus sp. FSL R5-0490]
MQVWTDMPNFVKRELEQLEEIVSPIMKKASRYIFWSTPLIILSLINLMTLFFTVQDEKTSPAAILIYAIIGALGFALSKEGKHQQLEIQKMSLQYMKERISKSRFASDPIKTRYQALINENPRKAVPYFIQFLKEEKRGWQ